MSLCVFPCLSSCAHLDRVLVLLSRRSPDDSWVTGSAAPPAAAVPPSAAPPAVSVTPAPPAAEPRPRGQVDQLAVSEVGVVCAGGGGGLCSG